MDEQFNISAQKEQLEHALKQIESLPYAPYLTDERVTEYLRNIQARDENPIWHVNRLLGFGASEIGSLVADIRNRQRGPGDDYISTFKSARDVVAEKLMYSIPETNDDMQRGKRLESYTSAATIEQLREAGHVVERDTESLEKLKQSDASHSKYPWLKGKNVDDILLIDGKRILTDYKVPTADAFEAFLSNDGGFSYHAQLNQYDLFAKDKGITFDGFCLVPLNLKNARVATIFLNHDYDLQREIIDAGEHYWNNFVMRGRLPDIATAQDYVFDPNKLPDDIYKKAAQYVALATAKEVLDEQMREQKKQIEAMFSRNTVSGTVAFELGGITATTKQDIVLNEQAILEEAEKLGIDPSKYETKGKISFKRLFNRIEKLAESDDSIYLDQLFHIEQKGTVRKAGKSKPGHVLYETMLNESLNAITPVIHDLTQSQMDILHIIKDGAMEQQRKVAAYQNASRQLEPQPPLELTVEDVIFETPSSKAASASQVTSKTSQPSSDLDLTGTSNKSEEGHTQSERKQADSKTKENGAPQNQEREEAADTEFEAEFDEGFSVDFSDMDDGPPAGPHNLKM